MDDPDDILKRQNRSNQFVLRFRGFIENLNVSTFDVIDEYVNLNDV